MPKRSKLEIYFDLLKVVGSGETKPTRIMYRANLSWVAMEELLHRLVDHGFVRETPQGRYTRYHLTPKGARALNHYRDATRELRERPVAAFAVAT
jgi:predicted transcriptional regulator